MMTAYPVSQNFIFQQSLASPGAASAVTGSPKGLLRLEGALAFTAAMIAYWHFAFGWELFGLLFLAPDLSMLGYLAGPKIGAASYNLAHTYVLPFVLGISGLWLPQPFLFTISLIFAAHIGFDRMLGYGLKYPAGFGNTHLGIVGTSFTVSSSSCR